MISKKAKYAFKALIHLAGRADRTVQTDEIARAEGIPRKFLEQILLELKHRGLIASRRGRAGGYTMAARPQDITVGQVLRMIDGPVAPLSCISRTAYRRCADCRDEATCGVRRMFADAHAATLRALDATTLAQALADPSAVDGNADDRRTAAA